MVTIDQELCIGCGICAKDCPGHAIAVKEGKAQVIHSCIQCGHCVAVCPVRAAAIPEYDMEDVEEYDPETFRLSPETFLHAVKFRRSIRNFKEKPLEKEKLERIIDAGRYTATAKNAQASTFVVVQEKLAEFKTIFWEELPSVLETLQEAAPAYVRPFRLFYEKWKRNPQDDTFFFNAPCFLLTAAENPLDGGLAAANMENQAVAEGAGALYSGYLMRAVPQAPGSGNGWKSETSRWPAVCCWDIRLCRTGGRLPERRRMRSGNSPCPQKRPVCGKSGKSSGKSL